MKYYPPYLAHYGILGMKWGVRRYQSYDEVPRGSGKGGKEVGLAKKSGDFIKESYTKMRQKSRERTNSRIINSGNPQLVQKYINRLNNDEVERALKRIDLTAKVDKAVYDEAVRAKQKVSNVLSLVGETKVAAENLTGIYNLFAKVANTVKGEERFKVVNLNKDKGNGKERKISEKARKLIREGNYDYILKNKEKFTTDEIDEAIDRYSKIEDLTGKANRGQTKYEPPKRTKTEVEIPTYSEPSSKKRKKEVEIPTYSEPSSKKRKKEVEIPTYSEPGKGRKKSMTGSETKSSSSSARKRSILLDYEKYIDESISSTKVDDIPDLRSDFDITRFVDD